MKQHGEDELREQLDRQEEELRQQRAASTVGAGRDEELAARLEVGRSGVLTSMPDPGCCLELIFI